MKTKQILILSLAPIGAGCVKTETYWGAPSSWDAPLTTQQKQQVADHAAKILAATPRSLAGDDQDWDDAIQQAHREAKAIYSPLVQFEYHREGGFFLTASFAEKTGRWRYVESAQPAQPQP